MAIPRARVPDLGSWAGLPERNTVSFAKTWRRYCLRHNRLLTRAAPYGADSEPRTSESGCAITYDVLFSTALRLFSLDWRFSLHAGTLRTLDGPMGAQDCHTRHEPCRASVRLGERVASRYRVSLLSVGFQWRCRKPVAGFRGRGPGRFGPLFFLRSGARLSFAGRPPDLQQPGALAASRKRYSPCALVSGAGRRGEGPGGAAPMEFGHGWSRWLGEAAEPLRRQRSAHDRSEEHTS